MLSIIKILSLRLIDIHYAQCVYVRSKKRTDSDILRINLELSKSHV